MQPRRARAQNFDQLAAEARATAGGGDHQRAVEAQPRGFVRDAHDRARREHDALRRQVMNEGDHAAHVSPRLFRTTDSRARRAYARRTGLPPVIAIAKISANANATEYPRARFRALPAPGDRRSRTAPIPSPPDGSNASTAAPRTRRSGPIPVPCRRPWSRPPL